MASRYYSPEVLKYLEKNVRLNVYAADVAKDLGLTERQVAQAVWTLTARKGQPIVQVSRGVWRYDPSAVKATDNGNDHMLFEMIGQSRQGKFVLQDEAGDLYLAEKL